jgi:hypothetical protein
MNDQGTSSSTNDRWGMSLLVPVSKTSFLYNKLASYIIKRALRVPKIDHDYEVVLTKTSLRTISYSYIKKELPQQDWMNSLRIRGLCLSVYRLSPNYNGIEVRRSLSNYKTVLKSARCPGYCLCSVRSLHSKALTSNCFQRRQLKGPKLVVLVLELPADSSSGSTYCVVEYCRFM